MLPEVPKYEASENDEEGIACWKPLQVIVKIADIELTLENPKYPGISRNVAGIRNGCIVVLVCMYGKSEHYTELYLEFRVGCR